MFPNVFGVLHGVGGCCGRLEHQKFRDIALATCSEFDPGPPNTVRQSGEGTESLAPCPQRDAAALEVNGDAKEAKCVML